MTGVEFKIVFVGNKAHLTQEKCLTLEQAGVPTMVKQFKTPVTWKLKVLKYIPNERRLSAQILDYDAGNPDYIALNQHIVNDFAGISRITIRSVDTGRLLASANGSLSPTYKFPSSKVFYVSENGVSANIERYKLEDGISVRETFKRTISETFSIPIKDIDFKDGFVSFTRKFVGCPETLEIRIINDDVRNEFDAIKNYFSKALNTKKIKVSVNIFLVDEDVTSIDSSSPEISRIDSSLIENIKLDFIKSARKSLNIEQNKNIFTMSEYIETFADASFDSSVFFKDESQLFESLLKTTQSKHYRYLRYLSSKHKHQIMKLRFIQKPFSFIFLLEGDNKYHFIWETLDTEEATYVWPITKDKAILKLFYMKLEDIFNVIFGEGKIAYLKSNKDELARIYHDYTDVNIGFDKWKEELQCILI